MAFQRLAHDDSLDGLMQRMDQLEAICEMAYHMLSAMGVSSRFTELVATSAEGAPLDPIDTEAILGEAADELRRMRAARDAAAPEPVAPVVQVAPVAAAAAAQPPATPEAFALPDTTREDRACIERLTSSLAAEIDRRVQGEIAYTQAQVRAKRVYAYATHWRNRALAAEAHRNTALRVLRDLATQIDRNVPSLRQAEIFQVTRKVLGEAPGTPGLVEAPAQAAARASTEDARSESARAEAFAAAAQDAGFSVALQSAPAAQHSGMPASGIPAAGIPAALEAAVAAGERPPLTAAELLQLKPVS